MISPPQEEAEKSSFWLEGTDIDMGLLHFTLTSGVLRKKDED